MADIELVIKIPEKDWEFIKAADGCRWSRTIIEGVLNGTLLPKKLVDADKFINSLKGIERLHIDDELRNNILKAVYINIIKADNGESEGEG